jgi:hypothetical protein
MGASVKWEGLDELRAALRQLPADLTAEASLLLEGVANGAMADMRAEYPPGELRDGLSQTTLTAGRFGTGIRIRNSSGWSWHWDHGTRLRHWRQGKSTGAEWGETTPKHTFGRAMAVGRRRWYTQAAQMLERNGLTVTVV